MAEEKSQEIASTEPVYPKVELNFQGVFVRFPFAYHDGLVHRFTDHDFAGMNLSECITFLERFMQENCKKLYYCLPNRPLHSGIRLLARDMDYCDFIVACYETDGFISLYVDHFGDELEDYFGSDDGVPQEEDEQEESHNSCVVAVGNDDEQANGWCPVSVGNDDDQGKEKILDDAIGNDSEIPIKRRTSEDDFLSKLCVEEGLLDSEDMDDGVENDSCKKDYPIFNEETHWKKQMPVLGMRFKNAAQMKTMLCNYAVSNGYQLCYEKSDKKRLLVKCCKGECTFRLWATWMSEELSFQIKSLKTDHNCARNFKLGSIVTYKWLGSHYTKEIIHRQKLSARKLRLDVIKKFGIHVSIGQCRRAKTYAMQLIEGTLVEHYARLWSYAEEIRRSNPGSNVKLQVERMPDGKNYFSKFYICFSGLRRGWLEGCRRIIGLDGCFLKGLCKGELLTAVGRDANDQIYPIAWAVVCVENKEN